MLCSVVPGPTKGDKLEYNAFFRSYNHWARVELFLVAWKEVAAQSETASAVGHYWNARE